MIKSGIIVLLAILVLNGLTYSIYIAYRVSRDVGVKLVWLFFGICSGGYVIHEFFDFSIKTYFAIPVTFTSTILIYLMTRRLKKEAFMKQIRLNHFIFELIIIPALVFGPIFHYLIKNFGSPESLKQTISIMGITNMGVLLFSLYFSRYYSKKKEDSTFNQIISFIVIIILLLVVWLRTLS